MTITAGTEAFSSEGSGPNASIGIALSHGFTGSPASMIDWARHLADAGYAVTLPLLPGHGTSWEDLATSRWQDWYGAFEAEYLRLRSKTDHTFVAGLSMGGTLALRTAAEHRVSGVVAVNPGFTFYDPKARFARILRYIRPTVPAIGDDIKKPGVREAAYIRTPVAAVDQLHRLFRDTTSALHRVSAPTLIFQSSVDRVVPPSSVSLIEKRLGSADLEVVRLYNSYHVATMDNDAGQIFEQTGGFIQQHSGTGDE
ncbi:alpha/beta hydrolase [Arthrobacter castelli]|uniref:alpha/beta hydrolase n=1 Tax=Arthrobacter castelli TaxID=271431 RepID=UPI00041180BE|nr:alpha/beta fold hydrolase [Arthrobacter castelli]